MLLAIDIGNTNIVFGVYEKEWINDWRIQTDPLKTADEYEVIFRSLLSAGKICRGEIKNIIISTVVPSLLHPFHQMLENLFPQSKINTVNAQIYHKLPVKILNPNQIGTDLVANSVAAVEKYGGLSMIVDFGTALTFTTLGEDNEICGVAIAPGLRTAVNALAGRTAQLPQIHLTPPPSVLGRNTVHAIQSGIIFGFTGMVDTMIEKTEQELCKKLTVIATGGLSKVVAPLTKHVKITEPMLTLEGLAKIANHIENE